MSSEYQRMIEDYTKGIGQGLTSGHTRAPQNMGIIGATNAVTNTVPDWEIDWRNARNQYAMTTQIAEELHEPKFFGVPMAESHVGGFGRKVNALWALGFRLHLAGLYHGMQQRVYATAIVGEEVHIFMQTKQGKVATITDTKANFPSDELITKLRMLEG
jgi:hypothetical protein